MNTMRENYCPEIEVSDKLGGDLMTQYKQLIGILRGSVEMRHIDLNIEVSFLLSFRVSPCEEHLETAHKIFTYSGKTV